MFGFLDKLLGKTEKTAAPLPADTMVLPQAKEEKNPDELELSRFELLQKMWGDGFSLPGDADFVRELAKPMMLDSQKSMLDMSAGLGGGSRAIAQGFKTYVTGLERSEQLAYVGNKISMTTGYAKTAPITHYNPLLFSYGRKVDGIFIRDLLYTIEDKDAFLTRVADVLKPRGHLVLTDYTCDPDYLNRPPVSLWLALEPYGAHVRTDREIAKLLKTHGFDVRVDEDITKNYTRMALLGLASLAQYLEGKKLSRNLKKLIGDEVDYWTKKLGALDIAVKYTRFYAIKR